MNIGCTQRMNTHKPVLGQNARVGSKAGYCNAHVVINSEKFRLVCGELGRLPVIARFKNSMFMIEILQVYNYQTAQMKPTHTPSISIPFQTSNDNMCV